MKKKFILLLGIVVIFLGGAYLYQQHKTTNTGYKEIKYSSLDTILSSEKKTVVYIRRDGCQYCEKVDPLIKKAANNKKFSTNVINVDKMKSTDSIKKELDLVGTPTVIFYVNGVEKTRMVGEFKNSDLQKNITNYFS
ncbi:MAG: thioredoxin family protein [Enterococcus sp.]